MLAAQNCLDLLTETLLSAGKPELLQLVRTNAEGILRALEGAELDPLEGRLAEVDPAWMARVYEAFSPEEELPGEDRRLIERLLQAKHDEEREIGVAFEQALLINLPDDILTWRDVIPALPEVAAARKSELRATPSAAASRYADKFLIPFGLTPLMVFYATEAIGGLAAGLIRKGRLKGGQPIALSALNRRHAGYQQLELAMTCSEVGMTTGLSGPQSGALTRWCIQVAQHKRGLFPQFSTEALGKDAAGMTWTGGTAGNLLQRWQQSSPANN